MTVSIVSSVRPRPLPHHLAAVGLALLGACLGRSDDGPGTSAAPLAVTEPDDDPPVVTPPPVLPLAAPGDRGTLTCRTAETIVVSPPSSGTWTACPSTPMPALATYANIPAGSAVNPRPLARAPDGTVEASGHAFSTTSPLDPRDTNGDLDVYLAKADGTTRLLSPPIAGASATGDGASNQPSSGQCLVAFASRSTRLSGDATGGTQQIFTVDACAEPDHLYTATGPSVDILDNNPAGAERSIDVAESFGFASVQVTADLRHTWIGDLRVTLVHDGVEVAVLHNRTGGSADDLMLSPILTTVGSAGHGRWTLRVVDMAWADVGTIASFGLTFTNPSTPITPSLLSAGLGGAPDGASFRPSVSADDRCVAFVSEASNLVATPAVAPGVANVYLAIRNGGAWSVQLVTAPSGGPADGASGQPHLAADCSRLVFASLATNLTATPDGNGVSDVFAYDVASRRIVNASTPSRPGGGTETDGLSAQPSISENGKKVAFASLASNLLAWNALDHDTNGVSDIYVTDLDVLFAESAAAPQHTQVRVSFDQRATCTTPACMTNCTMTGCSSADPTRARSENRFASTMPSISYVPPPPGGAAHHYPYRVAYTTASPRAVVPSAFANELKFVNEVAPRIAADVESRALDLNGAPDVFVVMAQEAGADDGFVLIPSHTVPASVVVASRAPEINERGLAGSEVTLAAYACFVNRRPGDFQPVMTRAREIAAASASAWDQGAAASVSYTIADTSQHPYEYGRSGGERPLAADTACDYMFHPHPGNTTPDGDAPLSNEELAQLFARELRSPLTLFGGWSPLGTYYGNAPSETTGPDSLRGDELTFRTYADNLTGIDWTAGYHCRPDNLGTETRWFPTPTFRDDNHAPDMLRVKVGANVRGLAPSAI